MTTEDYLKMLTEHFPPPDGWIHPAAYILEHGRAYTVTDKTFKGRQMKMKECYRNATLKAMNDPRLTYVEGYASCGGIPIEHAWCADEDGNVVDPTVRPSERMPMSDYFGVPFDAETVAKTGLETGYFGILNPMTNRKLFRIEK